MGQIGYLMQSNLAANSVNDLIQDADTGVFRPAVPIRKPSLVQMAIVASAVGVEFRVTAGDREIVSRSTLDSGGTTGTFPNLQEKSFSFLAGRGETLGIELRETAAAATTDVMAAISIEPVR